MKRCPFSTLAICLGALFVAFIVLAVPVRAQDKSEGRLSVVPQTPEWQKLSTLVGQWEAVFEQNGKSVPSILEVRMTADGSAIMHWMAKGTPHEMVTMFHPDGKRLLATHYCGAHNQPRMALVPAKAPNQLAFEFVDGTNIASGDGHMKAIVITFIDTDHHEEAWTSSDSTTPAIFKYTRKK